MFKALLNSKSDNEEEYILHNTKKGGRRKFIGIWTDRLAKTIEKGDRKNIVAVTAGWVTFFIYESFREESKIVL